jgi:hypothetical protein
MGPAGATRPAVAALFLLVMATSPNGKLVRWATPAKVAARGLTTAAAVVEDTLVVAVLAKTAAEAVDRVTSEDMIRVANWWIQMVMKYVQQPALTLTMLECQILRTTKTSVTTHALPLAETRTVMATLR